jgi:prenyl protein peptidase
MLCILYSHISLFSAIFISPLFFGLAHFHHMLEHFNQNSHTSHTRMSTMTIILIHLFQFSYTYIFGVYSSFLFIRTGHFIPSFIVHTLCNSLGVPDINNLLDMHDKHKKRKFILAICYLIGLWLFSINLFFLTQSKFFYSNDSSKIIYRHWSN